MAELQNREDLPAPRKTEPDAFVAPHLPGANNISEGERARVKPPSIMTRRHFPRLETAPSGQDNSREVVRGWSSRPRRFFSLCYCPDRAVQVRGPEDQVHVVAVGVVVTV